MISNREQLLLEKLKNIPLPYTLNNGKAVCEFLNRKYNNSTNSRRSVEKELSKYCKWHKQGNKYIITEVFDKPLSKVDKRKNNGGGNSIGYIQDIQRGIIQYLQEQKNNHVLISPYTLFEYLGLINSNYLEGYYNVQQVAFYNNLNEKNTEFSFSYIRKFLYEHTEKSLNSLESKGKISWDKPIWIHKYEQNIVRRVKKGVFGQVRIIFIDQDKMIIAKPIPKPASEEELIGIKQCRQEAQQKFGVTMLYGESQQYYYQLLFDRYRIGLVMSRYDIILTDNHTSIIDNDLQFNPDIINKYFSERVIHNFKNNINNRLKREKDKHYQRKELGKSFGLPNPIALNQIIKYSKLQLSNLEKIIDLYVNF